MQEKKIKMKGLKTPRPVVFVHGFINGRFKTACIDQDSNTLNSAYSNGKVDLYYKYCSERVGKLEKDISSICTEAETLLMELSSMPEKVSDEDNDISEEKVVQKPPASIEEAQIARRIARRQKKASDAFNKKRAQQKAIDDRRTKIIQRLVQIRDRISNRENSCYYDLEATQFALKERICIYGHGVLLKPMLNRYIPKFEYEWAFDRFNQTNEELKTRINEVIKKEEAENA